MSTGFYRIVKCPNEERNEKGQLVCYKKGLCWNYNKCTISKPVTEQDLADAGYVKRKNLKILISQLVDFRNGLQSRITCQESKFINNIILDLSDV